MKQLETFNELEMLFDEIIIPVEMYSEASNDFLEIIHQLQLEQSNTMVLMQCSPSEFSNDKKSLLQKILSSVGLVFDQVPIVLYSREAALSDLKSALKPELEVISFASTPVSLGLKALVKNWISTGPIDQLNKQAKTALWNDMKQVFKPNMPK